MLLVKVRKLTININDSHLDLYIDYPIGCINDRKIVNIKK